MVQTVGEQLSASGHIDSSDSSWLFSSDRSMNAFALFVLLVLCLVMRNVAFFAHPPRGSRQKKIVPARMVSPFSVYVARVAELPLNVSSADGAIIAAELLIQDAGKDLFELELKKDAEKDLLELELKKDAEKDLLELELKKDAEKDVSNANHARDMRNLDALRQRQLSALSKRAVLEAILLAIVKAIPEDTHLMLALVSVSLVNESDKKLMRTASPYVKMSAVNRAMLDLPFRTAAWTAIGLDPDVPFPILQSDLIYGDLSLSMHSPVLREVFLSNKYDDEASIKFFTAAAEFMGKKAKIFYEEEAAGAEAAAAAAAAAAAGASSPPRSED